MPRDEPQLDDVKEAAVTQRSRWQSTRLAWYPGSSSSSSLITSPECDRDDRQHGRRRNDDGMCRQRDWWRAPRISSQLPQPSVDATWWRGMKWDGVTSLSVACAQAYAGNNDASYEFRLWCTQKWAPWFGVLCSLGAEYMLPTRWAK